MADAGDFADVFAIPDFWRPSPLLELAPPQGQFFSSNVDHKPPRNLGETIPPTREHGFFGNPPAMELPPLHPPGTQKIPWQGQPKTDDRGGFEPDDPWLTQRTEQEAAASSHRSWSEFTGKGECNSRILFVSEAEPAAFDAFLSRMTKNQRSEPTSDVNIVESALYRDCLLNLSLGRSSVCFVWDDEKATFLPCLDHLKVSGFSEGSLGQLVTACQDCGSATRSLRTFVNETYVSNAGPSRVALANAVDKILLTVQDELGARGQKLASLLQLQALVRPVRTILLYFMKLAERSRLVQCDEQLLSLLFQEAQSTEYRDDFLHHSLREVLQMASQPWTDFVEEWIGLKPESGPLLTKNGPGRSFVRVAQKMWIDDQGFELEEPDFFLDEDRMPSFIPDDLAQEIFETGRNLRFIRLSRPDHPLTRPEKIAATSQPKLQWQFDWDVITRVEEKAMEYETAMYDAIYHGLDSKTQFGPATYSAGTTASDALQIFGQDEETITKRMLASMQMLDQSIDPDAAAEDGLQCVVREQLFVQQSVSIHDIGLTPHWSLLPFLSFGPMVGAQARLVNWECMRLLFTEHRVRDHLHLQRQYHLVGNGLFCSHLSHALFDPELPSAERRPGVALDGVVMGLRLSRRDNWPPASSELRLSLMGVLADSFEARSEESGSSCPREDLLASISFAVRDLSPGEIDRCMDPSSLEALDFLRLSYKPPPVLLPVMTPVILLKYDKIFRMLLRLLRMLFVVNHLFRSISVGSRQGNSDNNAVYRFRVEAHHFVTQLTAYFLETGIGGPWRRFECWLDSVQDALSTSKYTRGRGPAGDMLARNCYSPNQLRDYHERTLDEIMNVLLLRKRQQPVMELLEGIFGTILQFAKLFESRTEPTALSDNAEQELAEINKLYFTFKEKARVFINVCRGLSEKGVVGSTKFNFGEGNTSWTTYEAGENPIARLLLLLDMSDRFGMPPR
ncbi:hypothetical protein VTK73DRAFT_8330 [Phialemonium thermophilum]|uniref:Spindle pole body component n=1 Tax=Phialemonium thermophilum TaxID=223376 RepID=A0ABR3Y6A1_9PEZI